jgi:predicted permease
MTLSAVGESVLQELRFAIRVLSKSKTYCATVILMLALGIGAITAVFSLLNVLVLRNLNVPEPARLVRYRLTGTIPASDDPPPLADADFPMSGPLFDALRSGQGPCADLFAWSSYNTFSIREQQHPETARIRGALVSGSAFSTLGITAVMGRVLGVEDDNKAPAQGWVANISYALWKDVYKGDISVLGHVVSVNDRSVTIIGVLPADFDGVMPGADPRIFIPLAFSDLLPGMHGRMRRQDALWLTVMGRLRPGASLAQADANLRVIQQQVLEEAVAPELRKVEFFSGLHLDVQSGRTGWSSYRFEYQNPLIMAQILAVLVLVLVCVDLSSLVGARTISRHGELAVRRALGAGVGRMMRQLIMEQSILAAIGGILGVLFAGFAAPILLGYISPNDAPRVDLRPSVSLYLIVIGSAALSVILSTLLPAMRACRFDLQSALKAGGRPTSGISSSTRVGWLLFPVQVAISVALVVVAGLFSVSLGRLFVERPGLRAEGVLMFPTEIDRRPERNERLAALYARMIERIKTRPGVEAASLARVSPMQRGWIFNQDFAASDDSGSVREDQQLAANRISAGFFGVFGIPILEGRDFRASDDEHALPVCIVNQLAAEYFFPHGGAMGRFLRTADRRRNPNPIECQIVGIVQNAKYDTLHENPPRTVYLPYSQHTADLGSLFFCLHGPRPEALNSAFRSVLEEFIPDTLLLAPLSLREQMSISVSTERMAATLSAFLGLLALLLTSIALYGMVTWTTSRRTGEIGIRMALGASAGGVLRMILRQSMVPVVVGVIAGTAAALVVSPSLSSLLYETRPRDPAVVTGAGLTVILIAAIAAFIPALRAARIQPTEALKND